MRKCYATALVLFSWYLMLPPPVFPPVKDASGNYEVNSAAPLPQWLKFKTFESKDACKARLKKMPPFYKCIASYDTALKPRANAAAAAPSTSTMSGAAASHMQ
jgi:hypothetical protein